MSDLPPMQARADVHVSYHQIVVGEPGRPHPSDVPNGLTASIPRAAVIRTGIHTGTVDVTVRLAETPPPLDTTGWDETEEIELVTFTGEVRLSGLLSGHVAELPDLTPQGPGRYGLRVQARGRDLDPTAVPRVPFEFYLVTVWPLETGPEAAAKLGIGVAEELGLPDKSEEIRKWAREHALPESEPGRLSSRVAAPSLPHPERVTARTTDHQIRIFNPFQDTAPTPPLPDGLVAVAPDSVLIRTVKRTGIVGVHVNWQPAAPRGTAQRWERTEEVEFVTTTGVMRVAGAELDLTPQGVGRYGLRVHGRHREGDRLSNRPTESYLLVVWPIALGG